MTTVHENYELIQSEGHPSTVDVSMRILHGRTVIQESFSVAGIETLDAAEACSTYFLAAYADELVRIHDENLVSVKRVRVLQVEGERTGEVELDLMGPYLRRTVQLNVTGCAGIDCAGNRARRQLLEIAKGLREALVPRLRKAATEAAAVQGVRPAVDMVRLGMRTLIPA
jgi:hypothetical protein